MNLAAFRQYYWLREKSRRRIFADAVLPLLGFVFCFGIWLGLPLPAKLIGGAWLGIGIVYYTLRFRRTGVRPASETVSPGFIFRSLSLS